MFKKIGLSFVFFAGFLCLIPSVWAKSGKPSLAVLPPVFSTEIPAYSRKRFNSRILQSEVEQAIQATEKFQVLSRQSEILKEVFAEQDFSESDVTKGQAASKSEMAVAHFIVHSEVQSFSYYRKTKAVPNIDNKYKQSDHGSIQIAIKVIDTTDGAVKRISILKDGFSTKRKISNKKGGLPPKSHLNRMFGNIANKLANELIDAVFPMVVLQVKGGSVFINRGADSGLKKGEKLIVYSVGEEMKDPYTGESLGPSELELGEVKVFAIRPKFTIVKPVDSSLIETISANDILRRP